MRHAVIGVALLAPLALTVAGCKRGPKTPELAFQQLERSIAAGDATGFFHALDGQTRAAIAETYEQERLQRTLVARRLPEGQRAAALERLRGAAEPDVEHYFVKLAGERRLVTSYRKRLGSVSGPILRKPDGKEMWVARKDGMPFRFAEALDGTWGFVELRSEWALEKERAARALAALRDRAPHNDVGAANDAGAAAGAP